MSKTDECILEKQTIATHHTSSNTATMASQTITANSDGNDLMASDGKQTSDSQEDDDNNECWADADDHNVSHCVDSQVIATTKATNSSISSDINNVSEDTAATTTITTATHEEEMHRLDQIDNDFDELILHKAIFHNDTRLALSLLKDVQLLKQKDLVNKKDKHGNTALHLACMLGRSKEILSAFLESGSNKNNHIKWSIDIRNTNRWTPFHEACSYGNRGTITMMAKQIKDDVEDALHNKKLSMFLEGTKNYRLVLKWEFQSWLPFVSSVLPSDVCVINKQGKYLRIDTRLIDFEGLFRKKGDSCLVYSNGQWIVMNNNLKKYQYFETPTVYKDIDEKVDEFMSMDIMDLELKSSEMQLTRSTSGWIWKADKVEKVGRFSASMYEFTNVFLVTRKRREHLSREDLKRNKSAYKNAVHAFKFGERPPAIKQPVSHQQQTILSKQQHETTPVSTSSNPLSRDSNDTTEGEMEIDEDDKSNKEHHSQQTRSCTNNRSKINATQSNDDDEEANDTGVNDDEGDEYESGSIMHRESLAPPDESKVTWSDYIRSEPGQFPTLGRKQKIKVTKTAVKASVAMSEEFPLSKNEFLDLLSVVPIKMFAKLKEFVEMKLPDGFPVRLDIPVFPALTARISFEDFAFLDGPIDESLFTVPENYERDSNLLPGRFRGAQSDQTDELETD